MYSSVIGQGPGTAIGKGAIPPTPPVERKGEDRGQMVTPPLPSSRCRALLLLIEGLDKQQLRVLYHRLDKMK